MSKTSAEKCWFQGCHSMKRKITCSFISSKLVHDWKYIFSIFMCLAPWRSTSVWSVLPQTCKLNLIVLFDHQGCTEAFTARMCIIPLCCQTNTIICSVILLLSFWMFFFTSEIKLSNKIYDVVLFRTPSYPCVCTKLHVLTSKNTFFLVTEFICKKTDLFRIISMYITEEECFWYVF